jgi:hypothetical protein
VCDRIRGGVVGRLSPHLEKKEMDMVALNRKDIPGLFENHRFQSLKRLQRKVQHKLNSFLFIKIQRYFVIAT